LSDKRPAHAFYAFQTPDTIATFKGGSMNKIRRLALLILLALVCSSICWGLGIVSQRALQALSTHPWLQYNQEPRDAGK